jgi:microcystin degradation protein MlrC
MWSFSDADRLFGTAIKMCQEIEGEEDGIAAGVLIGNAFTDVPDLCSNILVVRAGDGIEQAAEDCQRIGHYMWKHRESFQAELTSVADAISAAERSVSVTRGPSGDKVTVFSDAA